MIDYDDNAEAAVREFADWFLTGYAYLAEVDKFLSEKRTTQQKTVADAVEWYKGVWPEDEPDDFVCVWNKKGGRFEFWCEGYAPVGYCRQVCTREQFEAYVKEQEVSKALTECAEKSEGILKALAEQEGEKWTHTYGSDKCYIKEAEPDFQGYIIVYSDEGGYMLVKPSEIKPIKPTISESEAWRKAADGHPVGFIMEKYNVVEKD